MKQPDLMRQIADAMERNKELAAQVERLREAAQNTVEDLRARARTGCDGVKTVNVSDWVFQELKGSIAETPAQSLSAVKAEVLENEARLMLEAPQKSANGAFDMRVVAKILRERAEQITGGKHE